MYIEITTRCNMECSHCGSACTENGIDMSFEIFKKAADLAGDYICIGGGEPTIHPEFWKMFLYAISLKPDSIWMATNGKKTEDALILAGFNHFSKDFPSIQIELSTDAYHEPIDNEVYEAFSGYYKDGADRNVINSGRCNWGEDKCFCPELHIDPQGYIKPCGCLDAPVIEHINKIYNNQGPLWDSDIHNECWKDKRREVRQLIKAYKN